jgi:radical SAM protein with 4Fe4S-binding SPASM domain
MHDANNFIIKSIRKPIHRWGWKKIISQGTFPSISVETIDACNARCIMCSIHSRPRRFGQMDWNLYTKIVDEISTFDQSDLLLNNYGEPLLDPLIIHRIRYAKQKGIKQVHFFSNGMLLTEEISRELIESGLDGIYISINALYPETYAHIMKGLSLDRVNENINKLIQLRSKYNSNRPFVKVNFIEMADNESETQAFVNYWSSRVDFVNVAPLNNRVKSLSRYPYRYHRRHACNLWRSLFVFANGDVTICCEDVFGKEIIGNLKENSVQEIWTGKRMQEIRKLHLEGKWDEIPLCRTCDVWSRVDEPWWM